MISSVDTNVLLDILIPNADYATSSLETLEILSEQGSLVISEMVCCRTFLPVPLSGKTQDVFKG